MSTGDCRGGGARGMVKTFKGVENFLKRVAFNLGNSPSQTEVKIISCIPIDVSDLQQKIICLEKQLEESRICRADQKRVCNTAICANDVPLMYNTGVSCNMLDVEKGTNPIQNFNQYSIEVASRNQSQHSSATLTTPHDSIEVEQPDIPEDSYHRHDDIDYYDKYMKPFNVGETKPRWDRKSFFRKKKKSLKSKPTKTQFIYYAQTPNNSPFRNESEDGLRKETVVTRSYLAEMIDKQYKPRPLGGNLSEISKFSKPICKDIEGPSASYAYESDMCSCCHGAFHNIDNHTNKSYRGMERLTDGGYYDSALYDVVPVKEKPVKMKRTMEVPKRKEPRPMYDIKCWPEDVRTKLRTYPGYSPLYVNYQTVLSKPDIHCRRSPRLTRRETILRNMAKRQVKVDRKIEIATSKSCSINLGSVYPKIMNRKPKIENGLEFTRQPPKNDAECLTHFIINNESQTITDPPEAVVSEVKTEETLNQIKTILQSVLQEVKVTTLTKNNTIDKLKKDAVVQKEVSNGNITGQQYNVPHNLQSNMPNNIQSYVAGKLPGNMATNMQSQMLGSLQGNMSTNIQSQQVPSNLQGNMSTNMHSLMPGSLQENISNNGQGHQPSNFQDNMPNSFQDNMPSSIQGRVPGSPQDHMANTLQDHWLGSVQGKTQENPQCNIPNIQNNPQKNYPINMTGSIPENTPDNFFNNMHGSFLENNPSNFPGVIPTNMNSSRFLNSCTYSPLNLNPYLPTCSKQLNANQAYYSGLRCFHNFPLILQPPGRLQCNCYRQNPQIKSEYLRRAATIATNTETVKGAHSTETEKLIKEIYKSMALNMGVVHKSNSQSEYEPVHDFVTHMEKPTKKDLELSTPIKEVKKVTNVVQAVSELFRKKDMQVSSESPNTTTESRLVSNEVSTRSQLVTTATTPTDLDVKLRKDRLDKFLNQTKHGRSVVVRQEKRQSTGHNHTTVSDSETSETETVNFMPHQTKQVTQKEKKEKQSLLSKMFNSVKLFKPRERKREREKKDKKENKMDSQEINQSSSDSDDYQTIYSQKLESSPKPVTKLHSLPKRRTHSKISYKQHQTRERSPEKLIRRSPYLEQEYRRHWNEKLMFHDNRYRKHSSEHPYFNESPRKSSYYQTYETRVVSVEPRRKPVHRTLPVKSRKVVVQRQEKSSSQSSAKPTAKGITWLKKHKARCGEQWKKFILEN